MQFTSVCWPGIAIGVKMEEPKIQHVYFCTECREDFDYAEFKASFGGKFTWICPQCGLPIHRYVMVRDKNNGD